MQEKDPSKVKQFIEATKAFGQHINQHRVNDNPEEALISSMRRPWGTPPPKLKGYSLSETDTNKLFLQAAYNVWAILDYVAKRLPLKDEKGKEVQKGSFGELAADAEEIINALNSAVGILIQHAGYVDDTMSEVLGACSELMGQFEQLIQRMQASAQQKSGKGNISAAIPGPVKTVLNKILITETLEKQGMDLEKIVDQVMPSAVGVTKMLFDMSQCIYQISELIDNVEGLGKKPTQEQCDGLRRELIEALPVHLRQGLPEGLNKAFYRAYKAIYDQYLGQLKQLETVGLSDIAKTFKRQKAKLINKMDIFLSMIGPLSRRIEQPTQPIPVVELPAVPVIAQTEETVLVSDEVILQEIPSLEESVATVSDTVEIPIEEIRAEEKSVEEIPAQLPVEPEVTAVEVITSPLPDLKNLLTDQVIKTEAKQQEISQLGKDIEVLKVKLETSYRAKEDIEAKKRQLNSELGEIESFVNQYEKIDFAQQRQEVETLCSQINKNNLILDTKNDRDKFAWLGIDPETDENKKLLADYFELQKQENSAFDKFIGFFSATPDLDYEERKRQFIDMLKAKNAELEAQEKELLDKKTQQITIRKELQVLEEKLSELKTNEIEPLATKISDKSKQRKSLIRARAVLQLQGDELRIMIKQAEEIEKEEAVAKLAQAEEKARLETEQQLAKEEKEQLEQTEPEKPDIKDDQSEQRPIIEEVNSNSQVVAINPQVVAPAPVTQTLEKEPGIDLPEEKIKLMQKESRYNKAKEDYKENKTTFTSLFDAAQSWLRAWLKYKAYKAGKLLESKADKSAEMVDKPGEKQSLSPEIQQSNNLSKPLVENQSSVKGIHNWRDSPLPPAKGTFSLSISSLAETHKDDVNSSVSSPDAHTPEHKH